MCPACKWRGRAAQGMIDVDQSRRCPVCLCLLERFDKDPPVIVDDEWNPNAITK
jgi:hypothetical protein